jgi:protein O-mannosyl-transferase
MSADAKVPSRLMPVLLGLVICACTFGLFAPALGYDLVNLDDIPFIANNLLVLNGLSPQSVHDAFFADNSVAPMYMPLLWISFMGDVSLLHASPVQPWGFHFTNVLLHALNAGLLFALLFAWSKRPWRAFFFAALWAFHPLRVESVAWVTERKDVLSGFFCLLCVGCYAWASRKEAGAKTGPYLLALASFLGGLLVKPALVPLPFVFLLLDFWPLRRLPSAAALPKLLLEKTPFFVAAIAMALVTVHKHQAFGALSDATWTWRCFQVPLHYGFYLLKLFGPVHLSPLYPPVAFSWPRYCAAGAVLILPSLLAWKFRYQRPQAAVGWLWFLVFFSPIIGIFGVVGAHAVADRYTYLPAMGLSIALLGVGSPALVPTAKRRWSKLVLWAIAVAVPSFLAVQTLRLLPIWRNSIALNSHVRRYDPNNSVALAYLSAHKALIEHDYPAAEQLLDPAIAAGGQQPALFSIKALCLCERQGAAAAMAFLRAHPPLQTSFGIWDEDMAIYALGAGQYREALRHAERAMQDAPSSDTKQGMIRLLAMAAAFEQGNRPVALAYARQFPPYADRTELQPADLMPTYVSIWQHGERSLAGAFFLRLARANPDRLDILRVITWALATADFSPIPAQEVLGLAAQLQRLLPNHPTTFDILAAAQANAGDFDAAVQNMQNALDALPDSADFAPLMTQFQNRQSLYRNHLPYREDAFAQFWNSLNPPP